MCFSAEASFASGAVLTAAGGVAVAFAARRDRAFLPFALIPVVFGLQQLAEGVVWHGIDHARPELVRPAALAFLFVALGWWPVWMPLAVAATSRGRVRAVAGGLLALGGVLAALLAGSVLADPDRYLTVRVIGHHIRYDIDDIPVFRTVPKDVVKGLYLLAVAVPLLIHADRRVKVFGVLLAAAAVLTTLAADYAFTSVWCFFAALLAGYLAWAARVSPAASPPAAAGRSGLPSHPAPPSA